MLPDNFPDNLYQIDTQFHAAILFMDAAKTKAVHEKLQTAGEAMVPLQDKKMKLI